MTSTIEQAPAGLDAEELRAQAAQYRTDAAAARAAAEAGLNTAHEQAQRLVAEAQQHARQLNAQAVDAERRAGTLEDRARMLDHAATLRQQVGDTAAAVVALKTEADGLAGQVDALDQRLGELGDQRNDTAAELTAARDAGDVDRVTALRTQLGSVDEVAAALNEQRQALQGRLAAIGTPDGTGELNRAAGAWQAATAELRHVENLLDPDRPEARLDALYAELRATVVANVDRIRDEQTHTGPGRRAYVVGR